MRKLLSKGADVNAYNASGLTALAIAAKSGDAELVQFLIENNANLTLEDSEGNSPLALAALCGHTEVTRTLIEKYKIHGYNIDKKNMIGLTPLLLASQNGYIDTCRLLVCSGNASTTVRDLDNFMNAEDWLRMTTNSCESELDFLTRANVRKKKGIRLQPKAKLLSDYILDSSLLRSSSQNVYTFQHCDEKSPDENLEATSLPALLQVNESCSVSSSPHVNSMFDVPNHCSLKRNNPSTDWTISQEVPLLGSKSKLFNTPYIAKRRMAPSRYIPNRQSHGLASGSLKPLKSKNSVSSVLNKKPINCEPIMIDLPQVHQKPLPPIKKISRSFDQ